MTGVCCGCGRVRCGEHWVRVEAGKALEPNTICDDCRARLYPNLKRRVA
jgi:hypothetical protein